MLRFIGSVAALALLMVGCGGGGGGVSSPPPPPASSGNKLPQINYTIHVTVSGLQGSGLVLQILQPGHGSGNYKGYSPSYPVGPPQPITSNGAFTFVEVAQTAGTQLIALVTQQPASPYQNCLLTNVIDFQAGDVTNVEVKCSQFAYVTNAGDSTISAYAIDAASGGLAVVGPPVATGTSPRGVTGTPDKTFVFVANEASNDVSVYAADTTTGALSPAPVSTVRAGNDPKALAFFGQFLYVANAGSDTLSIFTFDANTGSLTPLSPATVDTGKGPSSILQVGPQLLYVANSGGSNDISAFWIDPGGTGALGAVAGSPFPAGGNPVGLATGGRNFLYSANPDATNPTLSAFAMDFTTGALTPLGGSPIAVPVSHGIASALGDYLYVTSGDNLLGYGIDADTGALTPLSGFPVHAGANPYSITIDSTSQFLYVANQGGANISGFRLDASTGVLTPLAGSPFPAGNQPEFVVTL